MGRRNSSSSGPLHATSTGEIPARSASYFLPFFFPFLPFFFFFLLAMVQPPFLHRSAAISLSRTSKQSARTPRRSFVRKSAPQVNSVSR